MAFGSSKDVTARIRIEAIAGKLNAITEASRRLDALNRKSAATNRAIRDAFGIVSGASVVAGVEKATVAYADLDRRIRRIGINAGASEKEMAGVSAMLRQMADSIGLPFDQAVTGLETLVAQGQSLDEALAFLPSVMATAQASGAATDDLASSAQAMGKNFNIAGKDMQAAFDIINEAGKQGQFELKDMARYLPSLAAQFGALGYKGTDGVRKLAAILQTIRMRTGDASSAATDAENIFSKMYSAETATKFKKYGINIRAELDKAKKSGKDLIDVFLNLTMKATKGDLSKLPLLITDQQFQEGIRNLILGRDDLNKFAEALRHVDGSVLKDLGRVAGDARSDLDRMSNSFGGLVQAVGKLSAETGAVTVMEGLAKAANALADGLARATPQQGVLSSVLQSIGEAYVPQQGAFAKGYESASGRTDYATSMVPPAGTDPAIAERMGIAAGNSRRAAERQKRFEDAYFAPQEHRAAAENNAAAAMTIPYDFHTGNLAHDWVAAGEFDRLKAAYAQRRSGTELAQYRTGQQVDAARIAAVMTPEEQQKQTWQDIANWSERGAAIDAGRSGDYWTKSADDARKTADEISKAAAEMREFSATASATMTTLATKIDQVSAAVSSMRGPSVNVGADLGYSMPVIDHHGIGSR